MYPFFKVLNSRGKTDYVKYLKPFILQRYKWKKISIKEIIPLISYWAEPTQVIINGAGRALGLSNAGSYCIIDTIGAWEGSLIFC